jgi:hypothetical protein
MTAGLGNSFYSVLKQLAFSFRIPIQLKPAMLEIIDGYRFGGNKLL